MRTQTMAPGVAVAVDGTSADRAVLDWAAQEAERGEGPLLLAHAAGHLHPQLTFAERHVVRTEVMARGERILQDAAAYVHRLVPGLPVTTVVRLLDKDAVVPALAGQAPVVARVSPAWGAGGGWARGPVVAAVNDVDSDAHVVDFATDYAARRGLDITVLASAGGDASRQLLEQSRHTSLLLLPRPQPRGSKTSYSWPTALDVLRRSRNPVALVSGRSRHAG